MSVQPSRRASSTTVVDSDNDQQPTRATPPNENIDVEAQARPKPAPVSHWALVVDQAHVTPEVESHNYRGSGTVEDPYVVEFIPGDGRNPMGWPMWKKWTITMTMAIATLAVALVSSAYTGGIKDLKIEVSFVFSLVL
jgi:hypothetical protein